MSEFDGFCGPTYQSQSPNVDAERAINLYTEAVESRGGKSRMAMLYTPGTKIFASLGSSAVLGNFACRPNGEVLDRVFEVVQNGQNQVLIEMFRDGTQIPRGTLNAPTTPVVTMKHNGTQLMICTGGQIWVMPFATNVPAVAIAPPGGLIEMVEYCDGFGIALQQNSNQFWVSNLLDFDTWDGLSTAQVSEFPDNVVSIIVNQRQIAFLGVKASVVYANAGATQQPFLPIQGVFIENGCVSPFATVRLDNSVFWIGLDERGQAVGFRANGYTPQRVSNHAVESFWNTYPAISDAISYAYSESGHAFWVIYFPSGIGADGTPSAGATWVYDVATGQWHERAFWNHIKGRFEAHHSQNHCFAWGKHLVGDWQSGNLYQMGNQFLDDNGDSIVRVRRTPHISQENEMRIYPELTIDVETGLGPQPPFTGPSDKRPKYYLGDVNGNSFSLTLSDTPELQIQAETGTVLTPILNDMAIDSTTWSLSIVYDIGGIPQLQLTATDYQPRALATLPFATTGTAQDAFIYVQNGQIQINGPTLAPRDPKLYLRWSKDHAHTWSNTYTLNCGQAGQFTKRVIKRRMGRARTMTFEVRVSDPVPWRFVNAYVRVSA